MRKTIQITGMISILLLLIFSTMPGVQAISSSPFEASGQETLPQMGESEAKISVLLSLQVGAKLRCQQTPPTADELSMLEAQGINTASMSEQRVFIHLTEEPEAQQLDEFEALGVIPYPDSWIPPVGEYPTGFIVADMPVDNLSELAAIGYVVQLDTAEQMLEPQNDLAAIKINADDVWSSGYDGDGVRIAVLDSGLDTSHPDIPAPVASKDYSSWPVLDNTIANTVSGHGTHVTGSVVGQGTQSSGATHQYKGMAPGADLIFLKIGSDTTGGASLDAMTNAIKDAVDTYEADIITMSYGGWGYYHDGTRQTSQAVDYAFGEGASVFISAGNEADDDEHYSGTVNAYSTTDFIQVNVSGSSGANAGLGFNLVWYDGLVSSNDLVLEYYDSTRTAMADTWAGNQEESWKGTEHELSGYGPEAGWYYYLPAGNSTYYLKVTNNSDSNQFFHIYFAGIASNGAAVKFQNADPFYTVSSPADAEKAIAVGAYTTRKTWTNYQGGNYWYINPEETVDTMSSFSSCGPRVDSGAPQKPNIVAPGSAIISVRDTDIYTLGNPDYDPYIIDNDGQNLDGSGPADYYVMHGTSMACPITAGAAALLLEAQPTLKGHPADVRNLLQATATSVDDNDNIDGYGLLDIQSAIDANASDQEVNWLFMVYLDADNNLESAGIDDLNEMEVAGSTDNVKIVVQMDRAERSWDDDTSNGNWTGAKRFYVTQDTDTAIINSPVISDLGEVNMGNPATLQSFIEWSIANYPAQHYALVLWNHGSGWRDRGSGSAMKSICSDEQADDELTMTELRSALNAANATTGEVLDIVGFDACLMQMVEVAYQIMGSASRPLVDIAVGSEETEPGDGWDYATALTALIANPAMTPSQLATEIVDDYISSYAASLGITQSAAQLGLVDELATAIDSFAQAMTSATSDWNAIRTARSQAQEYYYEYYIDLYHFAQLVNQDTSISQAVRDAADSVMTAVTNAVIAEGHTASVGNSHGLSIYYPETTTDYFSDYETGVLFTTDTQWGDFLSAILFSVELEPDITVSPTSFDVTLAPNTTQDYTLTIGNDGSADLTYDITDQETASSQSQTAIESSMATAKEQMLSRSPDLVLTNSEYDMSIAVEDLSGIGRYTEATADEKLLLYGYPYAGTSYMTVQLDGSDYYQDYSTMDTYVTQTPTIDDNSIVAQWSLPTNVEVSQRLTLQSNTTQYRVTVTNNDATSHEVKIRFLLDTMLAYNDGAPFIVPGVGNVTTEREHTNPVFDYWQATDDLVNPTLTSNCTFDTSNKPYKVQFAYWPDIYSVPFDYAITSGQTITWDTAVGMYWNLGTLSSGEAKDVIFYYGTADPIIGTPEVSIVTLFTNTDSYMPEEDVTIYVDVGNGGDTALVNGNVAVSVQNPEGASVFEDSSAITVEAGVVASQNFTYTLSADAVVGLYTVTANVYDAEESLLDEAIATFTVSSADCSWLDESPTSGTVEASSADPVTVTIDTTGLAEGSYSAEIVIASNDTDEASTTVPVTLQVSPAEPDITVSPASFDMTLAPDTMQDYTLTIGNDGGADLTYDVTDQETTSSQSLTTIESTPVVEPGINACGNEAVERSRSQMVVPRSVGEVITSFSAPAPGPLGLAWDGEYLWNADWETNMIYKLSPSTGSVVQSFSSPGGRPYGLTYDGTYLWVADRDTDLIYQLDPATGSVIRSIPTPGVEPMGLTWDGEHLWVAEHYDNKIYKLDASDGSIIQSFDWTGTYIAGLAWDGAYLWSSDSDFNTIYKLNPTDCSVITSFSSPGTWPAGLTWDGQYIWHSDCLGDIIYQIDVGAQQDCSWLDESPTSGTVGAGSADSITVTVDTTGLAEGSYSAEIVIASNDTDEASTTVPVTLQVSGQLPTVASISLNSGEQGATLEVTIGGTNFTGATAISFGDEITVNSFTVVSSTQVTTNISINAAATAGSRDVSVTTPNGTGTLADGFTVVGGVVVNIDAPAEAEPDSDFTANININEVTDFDACNYDVSFDASVLRLDNVASGLIGSTTIPVDVYNEISSGTYRVIQNVPGITGVSGSGYLAVLHFHVVGSGGDSSAISLSNGLLANNLAEEITANWVGDSIDISSTLPGDANGDGNINALDVTKVERIIAGLDTTTPGADANQDGNVNALDITLIERMIAGLS